MTIENVGCVAEESYATFEWPSLSVMLDRKLCCTLPSANSMACQVNALHNVACVYLNCPYVQSIIRTRYTCD